MTLQSYGRASTDAELRALAPWFHNLHLPDGRQTAPDHPLGDFPAFKFAQFEELLPADMTGLRVLDIGCNAGFYAIALARRGARVLGVDVDPHYLRQAAWARERFDLSAEQLALRQMNVYELVDLKDAFDLVLFLGVLYHLRYPMLALDIVAERVEGTLVLQSLTMPGDPPDPDGTPEDLRLDQRDAMRDERWPKLAFIEHSLAGDPTNWWAPNRAALEAMLRCAGFDEIVSPGHEIFIASRSRSRPHGERELPRVG